MSDPFDLSQYNTSFLKVSSYEPQAFEFADFSTVFATVAEAIRARQAGISVGYIVPLTSFVNVDVFDTTNPNGLVDSITRFQDAVREFVDGLLIDEYGKLPNCNVHIGFFNYANGLPIFGVQAIAPNGVNFTAAPDPAIVTKPIEFAKAIGACINEIIYGLNILRNLHGKMFYSYPVDEICTDGPISPGVDDCPPSNDTICGALELDVRENGCTPFTGLRCVNGTNICAVKNETNPISPNVWYTVKIPDATEYCGNFWGEFLLLKFTVTQNDIIPVNDPDANFSMRVYRGRPDCTNIEVHPFYQTVAANPAGVCIRQGERYYIEVFGTSADFENNFKLCYELITCIPGYEFSEIAPPPPVIPGCTDPFALNYNPLATVDDGSCEYVAPPPPVITGCTDPAATNYNPLATIDDGSCVYSPPPPPPPPPPPVITGCTDPAATNYNPAATIDDGSCVYSPPPPPPPPPPPDACFAYGTKILMADGSLKNIEDIVIGEMVMAYAISHFADVTNKEIALATNFTDISNNTLVPSEVINIRKGQEKYYFIINNLLKATFEHPIFVKIYDTWRFVEVRNLQVGYKMLNNDGEEVEIFSIETVNTPLQTANLTIKDYATYVAESIIVHNVIGSSGSSGSPPQTTISDAKDEVDNTTTNSITISTANSSIGGLSGDI